MSLLKRITFLILIAGTIGCGRNSLEDYLFKAGKRVSGYCWINSIKYEDSRIYDPYYHSDEDPHYSISSKSSMFVDDLQYVFSCSFLSLPNTKIPVFKYRLSFYLPCEYNGWFKGKHYEITEDNRWVNKLPVIFSRGNVRSVINRFHRTDLLGCAILRDYNTNEEISLRGVLDIYQMKIHPDSYTLKYDLVGMLNNGTPMKIKGECHMSVNLDKRVLVSEFYDPEYESTHDNPDKDPYMAF